LLYDPATGAISGFFDFDFAKISHPLDEYSAYSFGDFGGNLGNSALKSAIMSGVFDVQPPTDEVSNDLWVVAKAWDAALSTQGAIRPASSKDLKIFLTLKELEELLCPSQLSHPTLIKRLGGDDKVKEAKEKAEEALSNFLAGFSF
jgi:hypothetical protein